MIRYERGYCEIPLHRNQRTPRSGSVAGSYDRVSVIGRQLRRPSDHDQLARAFKTGRALELPKFVFDLAPCGLLATFVESSQHCMQRPERLLLKTEALRSRSLFRSSSCGLVAPGYTQRRQTRTSLSRPSRIPMGRPARHRRRIRSSRLRSTPPICGSAPPQRVRS